MEVINETQRSKDYSEIANSYRPGHADYTFDQKYGFRDYRGGGRSSGRETIGRVAGGAVAMKLLEQLGISITAYASSIGPVTANTFCPEEIDNNPFHLPDAEAAAMAQKYVDRMMEEKESSGGVIECRITGVPAGLGDPVFEKLDANLSKALVSIGAVKGIEIGDGFAAAHAVGSENNDSFYINDRKVNAQKFETAFYAKPDLRNVRPPEEPAKSEPATLDLESLVEQLQKSPELASALAALIAAQAPAK